MLTQMLALSCINVSKFVKKKVNTVHFLEGISGGGRLLSHKLRPSTYCCYQKIISFLGSDKLIIC
jgi:hypothetical protein